MNKPTTDNKIMEVLQVIQQFAAGDFTSRLSIDTGNELLDALTMGINMMGEELEAIQVEREENTRMLKNAMLDLERENYLLNSLMDHIPDHLYFKDLESRFQRVSKSKAINDGFNDPAELIGLTDHDIFPREHADRAFLDEQKIIKTGKPLLGMEELINREDGSVTWVSTSKMPMFDKTGKTIGTLGISSDLTERKRVERALQESEDFLNRTGEMALVGGWQLDVKKGEVKWSLTTCRIHGVKDNHVPVLEDAINFYHPDYRDLVSDSIKGAIEKGKSFGYEARIITATGQERWISSIGQPVFESGRCTMISGTIQDITDRKQVEEKLIETEERIKQLIENMGEGIGIVNNDNEFLFANPAGEEIFGVPTGGLVGMNLKTILSPEQYKFMVRVTKKSKKGEESRYEIDIKRADGIVRNISITTTPHFNSEKELAGIFVIFRDITQQKKLQSEIKESENLLNNITNSAKDAIVVIDDDGIVVFWNKAAQTIFGFGKEEIMGKNFHEVLVPDEYMEAHRKGFMRFKKTGHGKVIGRTIEFSARNKAGLRFPVDLSLSSMRIHNKWFAVAIIRDIAKRKAIEEKLTEAKIIAENANQAKSEFLANMSHEIRTPMNAILGFAEILEEQLQDNPQQYGYIQAIRNSGKGLLGLINDILDLSKIEAGKLNINYEPISPFDIIEEIRQIFEVRTNEKKIDFHINIDPKLPANLIFDETRLRQVLFNLIGNAVKFTIEGGITVNFLSEDSHSEISHIDLSIEVIDSGIGIPQNEMQRIFEPFHQKEGQSNRKFGGTGLGLSITKRLVEIMGGTIEVRSMSGHGSTFKVFLPSIQVAALTEMNAADDKEMRFTSFQDPLILLVEDIESNRKLVGGYLKAHHIRLAEAENGSIAIDKARELLPDLILMDMQMPVTDGYEAIRVIKSDEKINKIPIVALTASSMKSEASDVAGLCEGYLQKPVSKIRLLSELKKFLPHSEEKETSKNAAPQERGFFSELIQQLSGENKIPDEFARVIILEILPEFQSLLKYRSNTRIRNFAELVTGAGRKLNMERVEAFGEELLLQAGTFNVQRINTMFEEFATFSKMILEATPDPIPEI